MGCSSEGKQAFTIFFNLSNNLRNLIIKYIKCYIKIYNFLLNNLIFTQELNCVLIQYLFINLEYVIACKICGTQRIGENKKYWYISSHRFRENYTNRKSFILHRPNRFYA